jgi:parallel beta-helix repeat protein
MKKPALSCRTSLTRPTCPTRLVFLLALLPLHPAIGAVVTNAYDDASQAAYSGGFTNNSNGGTGFGAWDLTNGFGTSIGGFIGDSTQNGRTGINTAPGVAFGLYANPPTASIDARRTFAGGQMSVGETFSFDMNVSWNGGTRGFVLYEGDYATSRMEIQHGGSDALRLNGVQIYADVFNQALSVSVTALSDTNLLVSINASSSGLFTTNLVVAGLPDRFKFYYFNNTDGNNGSNYEPYFNRLKKALGLIRYVALGNPTPAEPYLTWATAATNIQDAIDAADPGDKVLVSNGIYESEGPPYSEYRVAIAKDIVVRSVNGPEVTAIRGQGPLGAEAVRCVFMSTGRLEGFTLTNGFTRDVVQIFKPRNGGGVYATGGTLSNCILSGNSAHDYGGGIYGGTLDNCTVIGNSALYLSGGGAYGSVLNDCVLMSNSAGSGGGAAQATLNNCQLIGNVSQGPFSGGGGASVCVLSNCVLSDNRTSLSGGGAFLSTLYNCTLRGNAASTRGGGLAGAPFLGGAFNCTLIGNSAPIGGGAYFHLLDSCVLISNSAVYGGGAYTSEMNRCMLTENSAGHGGGAYFGILSNCVLSGNTATNGGGVACGMLINCLVLENLAFGVGGGAYISMLDNCTLAGNSAGSEGGGVYSGAVNNSIIYLNDAAGQPNFLGGTLAYSCTTPLPAGSGNFTNDPMFVSLATTNLRLAAGSPCRDTGNTTNAPSGPDLDGNARIVNGYVDVGAYEYQGAGQGDYDGDGMGNGDEGIAGTGFADSNDVFEVSGVSVMSPATISFGSELGRLYAVDRNDALVPNPQIWTEFTNNIAGTGGQLIINDPLPGTNRNYRVRVKLAP